MMIPSVSGGLWLGTEDGRVLREEAGRFTGVEVSKGLERHPVLALHEGEQGRLWIGTLGGGLACLTKGAMENWNTANGLPADVVAGVVEDQAKNLWLATSAGIYRVNRADVSGTLDNPRIALACNWMSEAKTAPSSGTGFGGIRAVMAPDGELWFATSEGVLNVDTRQPETVPSGFPVYIESAAFNGEPLRPLLRGPLWSPDGGSRASLRVPGDSRSLEIRFTALSYAAPEEIQFRHKLEGLDSDWVDDAGVRSVHYGRLLYGDYRFRVAARNGGGNWQEAAPPLAFVVPTPLYVQSWAILLYGVAAVALVAGIVRLVSHRRLRFTLARLEQQQSLERERMRIARDMHDGPAQSMANLVLQAEIIERLIARDPKMVVSELADFKNGVRSVLDDTRRLIFDLRPMTLDDLGLVPTLRKFVAEFGERNSVNAHLRVVGEEIRMGGGLEQTLFRIVQEALNNARKHAKASNVEVVITFLPKQVNAVIRDDGVGMDVEATEASVDRTRHFGLLTMRERADGDKGKLEIRSQLGKGTEVRATFDL